MFRKARKSDREFDIAALNTRLDRDTKLLLAAIREASAPAPGVRVFMRARYSDPIEYPAAVGWETHDDGLLVVRRADGRADATFAPGVWVGAERIAPESAEKAG